MLSEDVDVIPTPTPTPVITPETISRLQNSVLSSSDKKNVLIITTQQKADFKKIAQLISSLLDTNNAKVEEAVTRIVNNSSSSAVNAINSMNIMVSNIDNTLGNRIMDIHPIIDIIPTVSINNVVGVAAGDEDEKFGAWASPFYNKTNQGYRNKIAGYTNESYGATFGFDTMVSNDGILGAAITATNSNIKHKDPKSGDRTRINSFLFSIYNLYNITDNWFTIGTTTFATNNIKNHAQRVSSTTGYETANSKYSSTSLTIKELVGYNHITTEGAVVTPMFGLKFNKMNATNYKETGTAFQNLAVSTKESTRLEAIAGVKVHSTPYCFNSVVVLTPEFRGFVNYKLSNQGRTPAIKLNGVELVSIPSKLTRTSYDLGANITAAYGDIEYSAGYDLHLAEKLVGHQGSIKIRISF